MSLNGIMGIGLSALNASQRGLELVSQNVSNANTPGYARADMHLTPVVLAGGGPAGVEVSQVRRAADRFLAAASLTAHSNHAMQTARSEALSRVQAAFGDPSQDGSIFALIDRAFAAFQTLGSDPSNPIRRAAAVSDVQTMLSEFRRLGGELESIRQETDLRLEDAVTEASSLLAQVADYNREIRLAVARGADASAAQNAQSALVDRLAGLIDLRVTQRGDGGVELRTVAGGLLLGDRPAVLRYAAEGVAFGSPGSIEILDAFGQARPLDVGVGSGRIAGLLAARDVELPALADTLGALAGAAADALNAAHNDNSASPAPQRLEGRATGLIETDFLRFSGRAFVGVLDGQGGLTRRIEIDFDSARLIVDGVAQAPYAASAAGATIGDLRAALTGQGVATSFVGGRLAMDAGTGAGIVVRQAEPPASPADRGGRGFGHFFGLNDLVRRDVPAFFETGMTGGETHGLTGGAITFRIRDANGVVVVDRAVSVAGATINDMIAALNAQETGLGPYAQINALSVADRSGRATLTASAGFTIEVVEDLTERGATGVGFTQLMGFGAPARAGRASDLEVRPDIAANASRLALARPDLTQAIGTRIIEAGDGRGAAALAQAQSIARSHAAAGVMNGQTASLSRYAGAVAGEIGRLSADAERAKDASRAVKETADTRRGGIEGVNLDDELVKMTQFQQSYAAASRLIQAAKEMWDILLAIR
jgi:flagellar hook-associated protein 1 FlgK